MPCGFRKGKRRLASHSTKLTRIKEFDPLLHILFRMYACAYQSHAHIVDVVSPLRCEHFHIRHKFFPVRQENGLKRKRLHKRRRGINNLWGKKKQINLLSILLVLWINMSSSKSLVMLTCIPWNSLKRCNVIISFSNEISYRIFQNNLWTPSIRNTQRPSILLFLI